MQYNPAEKIKKWVDEEVKRYIDRKKLKKD